MLLCNADSSKKQGASGFCSFLALWWCCALLRIVLLDLEETFGCMVPALHAVALQVLTACLKSFAHGANDTANAAGPFAAVQSLYLNSDTGCQGIRTPLWVLAFCGVGIVVVGSHRAAWITWPTDDNQARTASYRLV